MTGKVANVSCALAFLSLVTLISITQALRTGAPSLACVGLRPFHGLHSAKPASASQFFVTQSSLTYAPGQNISVEILTQSTERYFRGFIVQAYNPITGANIGRFLPNEQVRPIDSCSAATHRDNLNKKEVTLTWMPPTSAASPGSDPLPSLASQWLGLQVPSAHQSATNQGHHRYQPSITMTVNRQRRQAQPAQPASSELQIPAGADPALHIIQNNATATSNSHQSVSLHQVRFRASIVVTYEEFYTGFESSDRKFDKFDYAPGSVNAVVQ